jgi:hypothetical protein
VQRIPRGSLVAALAVLCACPAAPDEDCPAGSTRVESSCVPLPLEDPHDRDRDDYADLESGGLDCNDGDPTIHPRARETCNGRDDDCDGATDEGLDREWFVDADGDGYGTDDELPVWACAAPTGRVGRAGDCNDADPNVAPGVTETCDGVDQDCDGFADEGVSSRFYRDTDRDGYGVLGDFVDACAAPVGFTPAPFDCDDADDEAFPGETDLFTHARVSGGFDYNCDGMEARQFPRAAAACDRCTAPDWFWLDAVPACGTPATYLECSWSETTGCSELRRGTIDVACW